MNANEAFIAVAIPAHDEAERIGRCLDSLAAQIDPGRFSVLVLANDCTDDTVAIARKPRKIDVNVIEHSFPIADRGAGQARRMAVNAAAAWGDIILTTDADCVADTDWIACHRAAFSHHVDAVLGRVSGDWSELKHLPKRALEIGAIEWEYLEVLAQAEAIFAPRAHDPLPRHVQCCGANIGITRAMLNRVGGVPGIATGEDHALVAAIEAAGGLVRHDPAPHVVASARLNGRASGGMADALAARISDNYRCDHQFRTADDLAAVWTAYRERRAVLPGLTTRLKPDELPAEIACLRAMIAAHD